MSTCFLTRLALIIALLCAPTLQAMDEASQNNETAPRNVILIIGDGMDDQQVTIARNYLHGAKGRLVLDSLPARGAVQILGVEDTTDETPVYVSDSANTATSMATGVITSRGRISTSAGDDKDLLTLGEIARDAGLRVGLVTSSSVTDATPAAFAAHVSARFCENPGAMVDVRYRDIFLADCSDDLKANGGPGSISEQLATSGLHMILGGGARHFEPAIEGGTDTVLELAREQGFTTLSHASELETVSAGDRVLGLFAPSHLPVRLRGEDGREAEAPEPSLLNNVHAYLGEVELPAVMRCEDNPDYGDTPSLKALTDAALKNLSHNNERGFFLMVESASIDKQAHERKPCGSIGEMAQLDEALTSALAFADENPETLVLVTADHAQAAQLTPSTTLFAAYPIPIYTPGRVARILTPEGAVMAVNYATNNFAYGEHTGGQVPIYGNGVATGIMPTYMMQPDVFTLMRDFLNLPDQ